MPKATLTFQLPEEAAEFRITLNAGELHSALWELKERIRSFLKYEQLSESEVAKLEELRAMIPYDLLEE